MTMIVWGLIVSPLLCVFAATRYVYSPQYETMVRNEKNVSYAKEKSQYISDKYNVLWSFFIVMFCNLS